MIVSAIFISLVIVIVVFLIAWGVNIIMQDWEVSILTAILAVALFMVLVMFTYALMGGQ